MNADINLAQITQNKKKNNIFLIASIVIFSIVFLIGTFVTVYSLILKSQSSNLSAKADSLKSQIDSFSKQKEKLLIVGERLGNLKKIVSARKNIDAPVRSVLSIIPQNFEVKSIIADEKIVSLQLLSPRLSDFDSLLEEKIPAYTQDKNFKFSNIQMNSFGQKGLEYSITLDFRFGPIKDNL